MELKANCKINLGLHIVARRADGYHDIETVMMPVKGLYDEISVEPLPSPATFISTTPPPYPSPPPVFFAESVLEVTCRASGASRDSEASGCDLADCPPENNLCMKALRLMQSEFGIGEAHITLHKVIPTGAGLGGGSSDAAAVLRALNEEFVLELSDGHLEELAARLGSDVPFFVRNTPQLCTGRGEIMTPFDLDLSGRWLAILKPPVAVSTAEAYAGVVPRSDAVAGSRSEALSLPKILRRPVEQWRELLVNDFEQSVFARYPQVARLKHGLYDAGALYASMSGSGSSVFGIFESRPEISDSLSADVFIHIERL